MDYKEQIELLHNLEAIAYGYNINGEVFGMDCSDFEQIMVDAAHSIEELLSRAEAAEAAQETLQRAMVEYKDRAEKAENIASDLLDDFTDFVTGGVPNASPHCANRRPDCVDVRGWCKGDSKVCKGFLPRAAIEKEE